MKQKTEKLHKKNRPFCVNYIEELRQGLVSEVEKISSVEERQKALATVIEYCMWMERKYQLGVVDREKCNKMIELVFNYLRRNRQLARRVGAFDKDVKLVLSCILSNLLVEYGTDKD